MRFSRTVLRVLAFGLLVAALVGVPIVVLSVVGSPVPGADEVGNAWRSRQLSSDLVVRIGAAVFALLWLWFAVTAIAELWHVIAWRFGGPGVRLAPLPPGPSGLIRGVVRFIALSSVSATATFGSVVPLVRASVLPSMPAVMVASVGASPGVASVGASHTTATPVHRATGRETPYSLAAAIGRPELRDRIIELNAGRFGPGGQQWQGGVFPAGMEVVLPQEQAVPTPLGPAHVVVAGDSYWEIADDHLSTALARQATPAEVLDYTLELVSYNHPLLGHREPALIIPGELVVLTDSPLTEAASVDAPPTDRLSDTPPIEHEVALPDVRLRAVADPAGSDATAVVPVVVPVVPVVPVDLEPSPVPRGVPSNRTPSANVPARAADARPSGVLSYAAGLGAALMLSAGAVGLLETRRRRQLRASTVGARLARPLPEHAHTEVLLRSLDASERLARLDLALRSVAPSLASQASSVSAALLYDTGEVCLFLRGSAAPDDAAWKLDPHANTWRLSGTTSLAALAQRARLCAQPCPAMVHLGGVAEGGELFVDVEAVGTLTVHSPHARRVLRSIAASLAVSPFIDAARVFTVGLDGIDLGSANIERAESLDAALDAAVLALGSTGHLAGGATTFNLRVAGAGGEAWEPAIVVAAAPHRVAADGVHADDAAAVLHQDLRAAAAGGRGMAVVTDMAVASAPDDGSWRLVFADGHHVLEPLGLRVQPVGLSEQDVAAVAALLATSDDPLITEPPVSAPTVVVAAPAPAAQAAEAGEPEWALLVRLFGQVQVVSSGDVIVECERSKATELIVWLGLHRERPTRGAARTALWDLDVRDATFANVVSDARRALARAISPAAGEEWIARTLTEELPLHRQVVTDAELLAARLERSRGLRSLDAIEVLRPGVELLAGMPLAGTGYLWPDAEGITSSLVLLATTAATELANHYLLLGDVDGVFWATGQGLKVLSGHEELISLRMRAHARRGDLAGVRGEWESYERALAADSWAAAEPAAKLVALRRELLASNRALAVEGA